MREKFNQFLIKTKKETATQGTFLIGPLFGGLGITVGNSLRRTLLSCLPGLAVCQIKVKGASHLFANIPGIKEDLIEVVLNIKQIRIKSIEQKSFKMKLDKNGPGEVKAGDIKTPAGVQIVNKDLTLAHLADKKTNLNIEFEVEEGVGYSLADEHKTDKIGIIAVDALFSPVVRVAYLVTPTRVGKKTDFDQLSIEIETNGTIRPSEALKKAAAILIEVFDQIRSPKKVTLFQEKEKTPVEKKEELLLDELNLPLRLINALKKAGYKKISDFEGVSVSQILAIKNVGKKSVDQLFKVLKKKRINFKKE